MNPRPRYFAAAILLAPAATAALAQVIEAVPSQSAVVITATRSERQVSDLPASVSVVSRDAIAATPAQSIDEVLRAVPGVEMPLVSSYQNHPTASLISMRGLKSGVTSHALVMIDGVPINDAFSGFVQWNRVPLENTERVEVVRGGGASLWGTYALGGVINIITRAPDKTGISAEAGYGSYGTWRAYASGALAGADGASVGIAASRWGTRGFNQVAPQWRNDTTIWTPTSFDAGNVALSGAFKPDPSLGVRARLNYHDNEQTLLTPVDTNHHRIWNGDVVLTQTLANKDRLTATLFHNDGSFSTNNSGWDAYGNATPGFPTAEVLSNTHLSKSQDTGASLVWTTRIDSSWRMLSLGTDLRQISGSDTGLIYDDVYGSASGTPGAFLRTDTGSGRQRFAGLFGQFDTFPIEGLEILGSLRVQRWRNDRGFDATGPSGGLGALPDTGATSIDPRLALRYEAAPELALRAAAYQAFNAPNLDNLHRSFGISNGIFLSNPVLDPERLTGAEIGFDIEAGGWSLQATVFENRLRDMITSVPLTAAQLAYYNVAFGTQLANAGKLRSRGLELAAKWTLSRTLAGEAAATLTDAKILESPDPAAVGQPLAYLPRQQVHAGLRYDDHKLQWSAVAHWVGSSIGVQGDPSYFESNGWGVHQDGHFTIDASAGWTPKPGLSLRAQVVNLFDRLYIADNSGYFAPLRGTPRTIFVGVKASFD